MVDAGKASVGVKAPKRTRKDRIYEDKSKLREFLGFDTDQSFENWRDSTLVKQWWEIFNTNSIDKNLDTGKKVVDENNLIHRIREGERLGKRKYLAARTNPTYDDAEDYHAWLVFWLAEENTKDRNGCLWNRRLKQHEAWSAMHKFVLWAKRQRSRDAKKKKAKNAKKAIAQEDATEDKCSEEEADLNPEKGTAVIIWHQGMPDELELEENAGQAAIPQLCSHSILTFWAAVDAAVELPKHMQRRCFLGPKDGSSFRDAQILADKDPGDKKILFYLKTEPATIAEETTAVPETAIPTQDGHAHREASYREMVDEAAVAGADRLDMSVRLWRYNLMQAMAKEDDRVELKDVHLDLEGQRNRDAQGNSAEIQAIQVSGDSEAALEDEGGLPLSQIKDITAEEIEQYHERNKWIDNSEYQPQNHEEACRNLDIPNPEQPRIEGLLPSISLKMHQPTAINALVEFENSCVGGALNAEEVGLGKTVEIVGLLLHRLNQRKATIGRNESLSKALPTLIVLPQNLIEQWKEEIFEFTDREAVCVYYGPPRKSGDGKVVYVPKNEGKGRLTRDHSFFSGAEENSDVIVLTSYATWATRHGPGAQWDWLCEKRRSQASGKRPTKKETEKLLLNEGVTYHSVATEWPYQLHGLFERVILDEGHTIRHQSEDIGIEEFSGIMKFLQNPQLNDRQYLLEMGFTEELTTGTYENHGKVTFLESALFWKDPYLFGEDHPKAPLKYCAEAMDKYLFNKLYNKGFEFDTIEQGRRLSQVLKKVMLRRTHSSQLNGVPIGKTMSSVQRTIFECAFTDHERAYYDYMMADESTSLFKKGKKGKRDESVEWSTTAYRKWCLLASWLGFQYLLDYKASSLGSKRKTMTALTMLQDVQKGQKRLKEPKEKLLPLPKKTGPESIQNILEKHCTGSPKLRQLLPILAKIVVLLKEKALLWVNTPAQAEWLEQDSESTLKNLPNLLTQIYMDVWGNGDEKEQTHALGAFVLHEQQLFPSDDPQVKGLKLEPLGADDLLMQIQMQLSGRKPTTIVDALRKQVKAGLVPKKASPAKKAKPGKNGKGLKQDSSSKEPEDTAATKVFTEAAASVAPANVKVEAQKDPLWI
ncbi:hypothetical protein E8E12_007269 [Didymella heteroderae]|uniref:Helicase ATP-binding domain-containing protein n=1 Tax=Didymella heteroderae TaxID=1769908 RepID=A0A9P5C496_9PLEO|nr:hypothetical protein E8E12_007269 [Didymella heteroderae]